MNRARRTALQVGLLFILLVACLVALVTGPGGLGAGRPVIELRLLRIALGVVAGGTLAACGAALQGLLRNPLADPFTLGVAGGAALGTSVAILLGGQTALILPLAGFAGATVALFLVYSLARIRGRVTVAALVLSGVIVSFLFSSLVLLLMVIGRRPLGQAIYILMGHLGVPFTGQTALLFAGCATLVLVGMLLLIARARELDIMAASEEIADTLGVDSRRLTRTVFVVCSAMVGVVVSFTGAISFVGLVVPHLVRLTLGPGHGRLLPASFVLGGALLLLSDAIARHVGSGGVPLSVVTALVGVPFFVYLLRRRL